MAQNGNHEPTSSDVAIYVPSVESLAPATRKRMGRILDENFQEYHAKRTGGAVQLLNSMLHNQTWAELAPAARDLYVTGLRARASWSCMDLEARNNLIAEGKPEKIPPWIVLAEHFPARWLRERLHMNQRAMRDAMVMLVQTGLACPRYARLKWGYGWYWTVYESFDVSRFTKFDPAIWEKVIVAEQHTRLPIRNGRKDGRRRFERWCRSKDGANIPSWIVPDSV